MFAFLAGLAAGLLHVFSGPDHLAAVAPLAADGDRGQWRAGLQWGIGHTTGVLLIALLLLLFREQLPLDAISANSERIVGALLIAVGVVGNLARDARLGSHGHSCHARRMRMPYAARHSRWARFTGWPAARICLACCRRWRCRPAPASILYLAGFGVGAIAGMTAFAAAMGLLSHRLGRRHPRSYGGLLYASSAAALVVGGFWLVGR